MCQFYGHLEKCALSAGKPHVHKIPRFRGGVFWVLAGGEGDCADFIFMGARIFLTEAAFLDVPFRACLDVPFPAIPVPQGTEGRGRRTLALLGNELQVSRTKRPSSDTFHISD